MRTVADEGLRKAGHSVRKAVWLFVFVAAAVIIIFVRGVPQRTASLWILGSAVLAFLLSHALRSVVRQVGQRHTEDKLLRDVRVFLENQPAPPKPVPAPQPTRAADPFVPSGHAGFVPLKSIADFRTRAADPVVFDIFPLWGRRRS